MSILENISESNPCGSDYKYDDEYIAVELEIEKYFNISNTCDPQWDMVILKSENILANHSKDLKILSYWLYAQWQLNGWTSFLKALETYIDMLSTYNKELFPKAEKRKLKIFEWVDNIIGEKLFAAIESFDKTTLIALNKKLENLKKIIPSIITSEEYDLFKEVRLECNKYIQQIEAKEREEAHQLEIQRQEELRKQEENAKLSKIEQERRAQESEILAKFSTQNSQETNQHFQALNSEEIDPVISTILPLVQKLLQRAPTDFIGYKILFMLGEIIFEESLRDDTIITDDFIPSNDIIHAARNLENSNVSLGQLEALIEQLLLRPTWIEGYYIVSKILYKLSQTDNAIEVENILFYFLSKEEKLAKIRLYEQNIVPENIVSWIQTKMLSLSASDNSSLEYQQVYQEVMKIKKEENAKNAFSILEKHYQKAQGEEARFRWRLLMVDFALELGDKKLALSLLHELERLIEKYQIDLWQPSLAISVYEMLLKPLFAQELSPETKERIYRKLSILDIQKVIKL